MVGAERSELAIFDTLLYDRYLPINHVNRELSSALSYSSFFSIFFPRFLSSCYPLFILLEKESKTSLKYPS